MVVDRPADSNQNCAMSYDEHGYRTLLAEAVTARDHSRGPETAAVTLVEYGDFECPYCREAAAVVSALERRFGSDLRLVFRANPRSHVFKHAEKAAEAAEAAAAQGAFWQMHDLLFANQGALEEADLVGYAGQLGLDVSRFEDELRSNVHKARVREQEVSGWHSHVLSTPTFFVNGVRFEDRPDVETLGAAISAARHAANKTSTTASFRGGVVRSEGRGFRQSIAIGPHRLLADLPPDEGGEDAGPDPHDLLQAALGACTAMTIQWVARKRGWPLAAVEVRMSQSRNGTRHVFRRGLVIEGSFTDEQRAELVKAADRCPVSKALQGQIDIETRLEERPAAPVA
jgi:uncharacterized OsmC-like protein